MFPKPLFPFPTPDPIIILKLIKKVYDILVGQDSKNNEVKDDLSKQKSSDFEQTEINDIVELNALLNKWAKTVEEKVSEIESQILKESNYFFEEFYESLETMNETNQQFQFFKLDRYKRKLDKIQQSLKGKMSNYVMKHISLDNEECRNILKMLPGEAKRRRMDQFENDVILEAIYELTFEIKEKMSDYAEELIEVIENKMDEVNTLASEKQSMFLELEDNVEKNERMLEEMKVRSMAMSDKSSYVLDFLREES